MSAKRTKTGNRNRHLILQHDIPTRPWANVGADLMTLDDKNYLVTVGYFSNFVEVDRLETTTSAAAIYKLKQHFNC